MKNAETFKKISALLYVGSNPVQLIQGPGYGINGFVNT